MFHSWFGYSSSAGLSMDGLALALQLELVLLGITCDKVICQKQTDGLMQKKTD